MFTVLVESPGRYRLEDGAGANVGWIHGKAIGFRGLRSEAEAIVGASAGWRTLQSILHRERDAWPRQSVDRERLRFVNDGAYEWVSDGRIPLARVYRTRRAAAHGHADGSGAAWAPRQLAIEFVVPSWMSDASITPLAHALWHGLAPLLGETSRTSDTIRDASHATRPPFAHSAKVRTRHQVLAG